jgi:hypothetical protein
MSAPVHQPGRREERQPRRQPEAERPPGEPADEAATPDERPVPPDHIDITV